MFDHCWHFPIYFRVSCKHCGARGEVVAATLQPRLALKPAQPSLESAYRSRECAENACGKCGAAPRRLLPDEGDIRWASFPRGSQISHQETMLIANNELGHMRLGLREIADDANVGQAAASLPLGNLQPAALARTLPRNEHRAFGVAWKKAYGRLVQIDPQHCAASSGSFGFSEVIPLPHSGCLVRTYRRSPILQTNMGRATLTPDPTPGESKNEPKSGSGNDPRMGSIFGPLDSKQTS